MKKSIIASLVFASILAVVAGVVLLRGSGSLHNQAQRPATVEPRESTLVDVQNCDFEVGRSYSVTGTVLTKDSLNFGHIFKSLGGPGLAQDTPVALERIRTIYQLDTAVVDVDAAGAVMHAQFESYTVAYGDQAYDVPAEIFDDFLFRVSDDCRIRQVAFLPSFDYQSAYLKQMHLAELDWMIVPKTNVRSTITYVDMVGQASANIATTLDSAGQYIAGLRVEQYIEPFEETSLTATYRIKGPGKRTYWEPGESNWFDHIVDKTEVATVEQGKTVAVKIKNTLLFAESQTTAISDASAKTVLAQPWRWQPILSSEFMDEFFALSQENEAAVTRPIDPAIAQLTSAQAFQKFEEIVTGNDRNAINTGANFLADWLRSDDENPKILYSAIMNKELTARYVKSMLYLGLARAKTDSARAVLLDLYDQTDYRQATLRAGVALSGMRDYPSGFTESLFRKSDFSNISSGVQGTHDSFNRALLGRFIHSNKRKDSPDVIAATAMIMDALDTSTGEELNDAILAAGNSGLEDFLPLVQNQFSNDNATTRKYAYDALRLLPITSTADIVVEQYNNEEQPQLREAIVSSVLSQVMVAKKVPDTITTNVIESLATEEDTGVLSALTLVVQEATKKSPEIREASQEALERLFIRELKREPRNKPLIDLIGNSIDKQSAFDRAARERK